MKQLRSPRTTAAATAILTMKRNVNKVPLSALHSNNSVFNSILLIFIILLALSNELCFTASAAVIFESSEIIFPSQISYASEKAAEAVVNAETVEKYFWDFMPKNLGKRTDAKTEEVTSQIRSATGKNEFEYDDDNDIQSRILRGGGGNNGKHMSFGLSKYGIKGGFRQRPNYQPPVRYHASSLGLHNIRGGAIEGINHGAYLRVPVRVEPATLLTPVRGIQDTIRLPYLIGSPASTHDSNTAIVVQDIDAEKSFNMGSSGLGAILGYRVQGGNTHGGVIRGPNRYNDNFNYNNNIGSAGGGGGGVIKSFANDLKQMLSGNIRGMGNGFENGFKSLLPSTGSGSRPNPIRSGGGVNFAANHNNINNPFNKLNMLKHNYRNQMGPVPPQSPHFPHPPIGPPILPVRHVGMPHFAMSPSGNLAGYPHHQPYGYGPFNPAGLQFGPSSAHIAAPLRPMYGGIHSTLAGGHGNMLTSAYYRGQYPAMHKATLAGLHHHYYNGYARTSNTNDKDD